jgi:hypothetical protein
MNISNVKVAPPPEVNASSEVNENPALPDNDGDADDRTTAVTAKAPPPPGTGVVVDKTA